MQYRIFVQNRSAEHFIASVLEMPNLVAEGETEAEALANVKAALENQLTTGRFVTIDVSAEELSQGTAPQMKYAGIFADDSTFDDWMEKLVEIRKEANNVDDLE
jgi:predicted RNase H-like HicB family nuclease